MPPTVLLSHLVKNQSESEARLNLSPRLYYDISDSYNFRFYFSNTRKPFGSVR